MFFIIFLVSGFWHGANWTFIFWGLIHAILFTPSLLLENNRKYVEDIKLNKFLFPSLNDFFKISYTFLLVTFGWFFFKSESISDAFSFIKNILLFDFNFDFTYLNPYDNQPLGIEFL